MRKNAEKLEEVNRSLTAIVNRNGLTNPHNQRHFWDVLHTELARSERHGHPFSVLFIDVDHFKQYNDTHGHLAGDDVLRGLAEILRSESRKCSLVARYGGEEFVILIPEVERAGALACAEKVRAAVEQHEFAGQASQPLGTITVSIGVASFPDDATSASALIERADAALYTAKQAGRNNVTQWQETGPCKPVPPELASIT
ncbi:MAG: GGDEF domain-containing protein [Acidobacteriota bacterium]|nr:MAG: GGDEF domain-containing protein [Acidobacteriota bacterium]